MNECPNCGSDNTTQTTETDEEGNAEFQCHECGEYFTDKVEEEK